LILEVIKDELSGSVVTTVYSNTICHGLSTPAFLHDWLIDDAATVGTVSLGDNIPHHFFLV
jgi:hypothetical protein